MIAYGITDKGKVRSVNQDSFRFEILPSGECGCAVLCDGMGGAQGGEIASAEACGTFMENAMMELSREQRPEAADIVREAAAMANLKVYDRAVREEGLWGMGTTLVGAVLTETDTAVVNIGDSRCYWVAEEQILQVTRDHSHVQELVDQGMLTPGEARSHPRKNLITRAVGLSRRIRSDIFRLDLRSGERLLLCSDGLSNLVTEAELLDVLLHEASLRNACDRLLRLALERGAPDNVTVVLLER